MNNPPNVQDGADPGVPPVLSNDAIINANGAIFIINQAGEAEDYRQYEKVIFASDLPGHDNRQLFSGDIDNPLSESSPPLDFTAANATRFMVDNSVFIRHTCNVDEQLLSSQKLTELVYIRFLMVRNKLAGAAVDPRQYHCTINNVEVHDHTGAFIQGLRNHPSANTNQAQLVGEINRNPDHYQSVRVNFSTIVCCIAKVFRAKGHHFITESTDKEFHRPGEVCSPVQ